VIGFWLQRPILGEALICVVVQIGQM